MCGGSPLPLLVRRFAPHPAPLRSAPFFGGDSLRSLPPKKGSLSCTRFARHRSVASSLSLRSGLLLSTGASQSSSGKGLNGYWRWTYDRKPASRGATPPPTQRVWHLSGFRRGGAPFRCCVAGPAGRRSGLRPPDCVPAARLLCSKP